MPTRKLMVLNEFHLNQRFPENNSFLLTLPQNHHVNIYAGLFEMEVPFGMYQSIDLSDISYLERNLS
jgi:hypothetical protein